MKVLLHSNVFHIVYTWNEFCAIPHIFAYKSYSYLQEKCVMDDNMKIEFTQGQIKLKFNILANL